MSQEDLQELEDLEEKKKKKGRKKKKKKRKVKKKKGKRDACYHKVKARYSVWPSAYASGALVKCRKVGAKNWGNKSKKNESTELVPVEPKKKIKVKVKRKIEEGI
jgi:hypothetical protein